MNKPALLRLAVAGVLLVAAPAGTRAAGRVECSAVKSHRLGRAVRYCALLPPSYDTEKIRRYPVLYYLHGLFENEQSLVDFGGWNLVEGLQESGRIGEFLIVTPDGDTSFYINSRDGRQRYADFFIREFLPAIDRKYRTRARKAYRGIGGSSMGGYGALRFAFQHPELFVSISAHGAALAEKLPDFAPARGRAGVRQNVLREVFGSPPDQTFFDQNNPLRLARESKGLATLKIYFDCGREDEYGFDAGAEALHKTLRARRIAHEFHLYPGGHGWLYIAEHLHASLEFHSRAFGSAASR